MKLHSICFTMVSSLRAKRSRETAYDVRTVELKQHTMDFKQLLKDTLEEHLATGLYTPNFHLLDQVGDNLEQFECSKVLHALPIERLNVHIKGTY